MAKGADVTIDAIDRSLIALLREDGRLSVNELAVRANVSRANAYQRLARLRERGVIRRFTIDVDHRQLGDPITALVLVDIEQQAWRELSERLVHLPGVDYIGFCTGTADVVLLVRAPDMEHLRDVVLEKLQSMPEVRSTQTSFVLQELPR